MVSKGGARDGDNIHKAKEADGVLFIQEIVRKAHSLKIGKLPNSFIPGKTKMKPKAAAQPTAPRQSFKADEVMTLDENDLIEI